MSYEAQSALLLDLKRGLRDPETQDDARTLLEKMRCRRDILSSIAEEVDELLATNRKSKVAGQRIPMLNKWVRIPPLPKDPHLKHWQTSGR